MLLKRYIRRPDQTDIHNSQMASDPPAAADTTSKPPFIVVPNINNLRDVSSGIQPSATTVRPRLLYRSGDPSSTTLDGLSTLHNSLGVRTIFDLRSAPEIASAAVSADEWESRLAAFASAHGGSARPLTRRWTPVFRTEDYGPAAVALRFRDYADEAAGEQGFVRAYAAILEHGARTFGGIIAHLAAAESSGGTLIHCSAGKDRAGVCAAVVLSLLGVGRDAVARDYHWTEAAMAARRPMLVARLAATGVFGDGDGVARAAERMTGARTESMLATLEFVDAKYGGVERYVREQCGVSQETIEALRRRFGVGEAEQAVL
jgi:protein tyrosine/serine phosphatase